MKQESKTETKDDVPMYYTEGIIAALIEIEYGVINHTEYAN